MLDIIIQPDGTVLVPRGSLEDNKLLSSVFEGMVDESTHDALKKFFLTTDQSEIIFGKPGLCG